MSPILTARDILSTQKVSTMDFAQMDIGFTMHGNRFLDGDGVEVMRDIGLQFPVYYYNMSGGIPKIRENAISQLGEALRNRDMELSKEWEELLHKADEQDRQNGIKIRLKSSPTLFSTDVLDNIHKACALAIADAQLRLEGMKGITADTKFFIIEQ